MKEISFKKIFTKLMYIAVFIYVVMTLVSQQKKIDSYESNINYLSEEIESGKEYRTELMATKDNINSKEYIEQVEKLFPNATIFKGNLEILYRPIKNTNKLIKEAIIEQTAQNEKFISQNKIR